MRTRSFAHPFAGVVVLLATLSACSTEPSAPLETLASRPSLDRLSNKIQCDPDNAGITLPPGFCALVVADLTQNGVAAPARHMAITPNGDIFVAINSPRNVNPAFGIMGLRDHDGDGRVDQQTQFSPGLGGSGIAWREGRLYFGANDRVLRYRLGGGEMEPSGSPEVVVSGLPNTGDHISKTVLVDDDHRLIVNLGSSSNACQVQNRVAQSPGIFPCPDLPIRAGIWKFDARGTNQTAATGEHYATGYRNMVALDINPRTGELFGVQHGRDMLFENWPQFFDVQEDAVLPAEEFVRITRDSNNGWPYCYFDAVFEHKKS
jgi:glucose/arabinose dehydrogenase